jgi:hypothetical protein
MTTGSVDGNHRIRRGRLRVAGVGKYTRGDRNTPGTTILEAAGGGVPEGVAANREEAHPTPRLAPGLAGRNAGRRKAGCGWRGTFWPDLASVPGRAPGRVEPGARSAGSRRSDGERQLQQEGGSEKELHDPATGGVARVRVHGVRHTATKPPARSGGNRLGKRTAPGLGLGPRPVPLRHSVCASLQRNKPCGASPRSALTSPPEPCADTRLGGASGIRHFQYKDLTPARCASLSNLVG